MTVTILSFLSTDFDYTLSVDKKSCSPSYNGDHPYIYEPIEGLKTFYSDEKKIFIRIPNSIYHFLYDVLPTIFKLFEFDKNVLFIIDCSAMNSDQYDKNIFNFLNKILNDNNIKHEIIYEMSYKNIPNEAFTPTGTQHLINLNNFYYKNFRSISNIHSGILNRYLDKYLNNKEVKPFRKVFVSRKFNKTDEKVILNPEWTDRFTRNFPERIDDEEKLAIFFKNNGFEIIHPENFNSIEDQLNYFYEVKTIVSLSGGGLSNALFMQKNTNMIEIVSTMMSPFTFVKDDTNEWQEYHGHFYSAIAFQKEQNYFGINNIKADSDIIIDMLSKPSLSFLLKDDL